MMRIAVVFVASGAAGAMTVAFVAGLVVVAALVWSIRFGIRVRRREQAPSRTTPQARRGPASGPDMDSRERREPEAVPRAEQQGDRLTPHDLHSAGSRRSTDQRRPRWNSGSGGSGTG
ncbi:DUF6479 family protein [Streptomyces sp. NPDC048664]|uniref:DUF6479 family protein n=1 Tax=Streptomyces sp. NPDC048664 TaxID=3154505 RepID=UPI00343D1E9F